MARIAAALVVVGLLAAPASGGGAVHIRRSTASYDLTLSVGPREAMYTAAEVRAKHPASGEVMLDGVKGGMSMGPGNRHLEVRVESRATNGVLSVAPTITLTDTSAMSGMAMSGKLHVMAMYGIDEGRADLHYGNNVSLKAGHMYKVAVAVKGERASFTFRAP